MKTDQAIYRLLSVGAEAFWVLTGGLRLVGPYQFRSLTFKALEQRADGVFEPAGQQAPVYVVEFHTDPRKKRKAWTAYRRDHHLSTDNQRAHHVVIRSESKANATGQSALAGKGGHADDVRSAL